MQVHLIVVVVTFWSRLTNPQDPGNRAYARAMDMIEKAPEIYQELQQQLQLQQASGRGGGEVRNQRLSQKRW